MLYLVALTVAALTLGYVVGHLHYRYRLIRAWQAAAVRHPAHIYDEKIAAPVEPPIDHDAMYRIIRQHQQQ